MGLASSCRALLLPLCKNFIFRFTIPFILYCWLLRNRETPKDCGLCHNSFRRRKCWLSQTCDKHFIKQQSECALLSWKECKLLQKILLAIARAELNQGTSLIFSITIFIFFKMCQNNNYISFFIVARSFALNAFSFFYFDVPIFRFTLCPSTADATSHQSQSKAVRVSWPWKAGTATRRECITGHVHRVGLARAARSGLCICT